MSSDLYIIAAGKGSRMNSSIPKALVPITDEPCLTTTLQQIGRKFTNVFVVTNVMIQDQWETYFTDLESKYPELSKNVHNVPINSGLGDGHATLEGFQKVVDTTEKYNRNVVIAWGDVFFQYAEIIDELLAKPCRDAGWVPAVKEGTPYVSLLVDTDMRCMSADFSKYGENHPTGFHDQSVFRFDIYTLGDALETLHKSLWKNGRYITPGGELSLLYAFHYLYNDGNAATVYETDYPTLSFNTAEEVAAIQTEIKEKWIHQHRNQF